MKISGSGPVPVDALRYFRGKITAASFDYRDVWRQEHAHAFTVAKAMQVDVLVSIRGALDDALAGGLTLRQFEKELTPTLQKLGWWGRRTMTDPKTGEAVAAQLGSPRRLKTIYRANMRTARAAGQWQRIERTRAALPYLLYELGPSREHRAEHVAWHGTLLPVDHPWWDTHYPPNGWGCKCTVEQVSRYEAGKLEQDGVAAPGRKQIVNPETGLPTGALDNTRVPVQTEAPQIRRVPWQNKRTGRVEMVPEGIDPGWDTHPGKVRERSALEMLAGKLDAAAEPAVARVAVLDLVNGPSFRLWTESPAGNFPIAVLPDTSAGRIGAKARTVRLSAETWAKQQARHAELSLREYTQVQGTVDRGREVQDTDTSLIYLLEDDAGYVSVVKATRSGLAVFLQSFRRLSKNEAKRSAEVKRLLRKEEK